MNNRVNNRYQFAFSYLSLSEAWCLFIINQPYLKNKGIVWDYKDQNHLISIMIFPIIFNLKHAIELLLKNLSLTFENNIDKTHNISDLYVKLNKYIIKNKKTIL